MKRVVVSGSRDWDNWEIVEQKLKKFLKPGSKLINGTCRGLDTIADSIALRTPFVSVIRYPANWDALGKMAGPLRNIEMLEGYTIPDVVLIFHEDISRSKGTAHMLNECRRRGIPHVLFNGEGKMVIT